MNEGAESADQTPQPLNSGPESGQIPEGYSEWRANALGWVDGAIENFGLWQSEEGNQLPAPVSFDPFVISEGEDERMLSELTPVEQALIKGHVFETVGFDSDAKTVVAEYEFDSPDPEQWEGRARVEVCKTEMSEPESAFGNEKTGVYLHTVTYPDGREEFFLGAQDYRIPTTEPQS